MEKAKMDHDMDVLNLLFNVEVKKRARLMVTGYYKGVYINDLETAVRIILQAEKKECFIAALQKIAINHRWVRIAERKLAGYKLRPGVK